VCRLPKRRCLSWVLNREKQVEDGRFSLPGEESPQVAPAW